MNIKMYEDEVRDICSEVVREYVDDPDVLPEKYFTVSTEDDCLKVASTALDLDGLNYLSDVIYENIGDTTILAVDVEFNTNTNDYEIKIHDILKDCSSSDILSGVYDTPERELDPPEDSNNFEQIDDYTSALEFPLDITVVVQEGCYPDIEDTEAFGNQAELYLYDKSTGFEYEMTEVNDVIEDLLSLLEEYDVPEAPGSYRMTGIFKLAYDISGLAVQHNFEDYGPEEGVSDDNEFYSDDLFVTFNKKASSIQDLQFELITEASTSVLASTVRYNDDVKKLSTGTYNMFQTARYEGREYALHYIEVDSSPEADERELYDNFAAQITLIAPYDDADYVWAKIENGIITYIKNQKAFDHSFYFLPSDMGYENDEWVAAICDDAIETIAKYNESVEPKIIHN